MRAGQKWYLYADPTLHWRKAKRIANRREARQRRERRGRKLF